MPQTRDRRAVELEPIIRTWWQFARRVSRTSWVANWGEFAAFWDGQKIRYAVGQGGMLAQCLERALQRPGPLRQDDARYTLLLALCRELQAEAGDREFFLACRTAGEAIGVDRQTANDLLKAAQADGFLELVRKGTRGKASRWRYTDAEGR